MAFCLLFGLLLLRHSLLTPRPAAGWLALILLLSTLYLVPWAAGHLGWYGRDGYRELLFYVPFQQLLLIGPCVYAYVRALLNPGHRTRGRGWWHFLPALVYLLYSLVMFLWDAFAAGSYSFYGDGRDRDLDPWYQTVGFASLLIYTLLSIRRYHRYRRDIVSEVSYSDAITYRWVRRYLLLLLLLVGLRLTFLIAYPDFGSFGQKFWYYLAFGAVSMMVAVAGYTEAIRREASGHLAVPELPGPEPPETEKETPYPEMDAADLADWKIRLTTLMDEQQPHRNAQLNLTDLAQQLGLTRRQTSAVINREFACNFNDFINRYRIRAVSRAIDRGEHRQRTLLALALEAGFNSKTTFNRVFKRETGQTPRQYVASLAKK